MQLLEQQPSEDCVSKAEVFNILSRNYRGYSVAADGSCVPGNYREGIYDEIKALPSTTPVHKKCKWILYDYRTLVPREHGDIPNPYWRIPARYKTELKYCPYCGGEIDYSEVDAEIEKRGSEA